jgi:hypothetical protein
MTAGERISWWLTIANLARWRGRDRVANYAMRRMHRYAQKYHEGRAA